MATSTAAEQVLRWRRAELAADTVLLDGFHALKHALRFGAQVPIALAADRTSLLALARQLAPDLVERLNQLVDEVPEHALRELVPRGHVTRVAALAVRTSAAANTATLHATPRRAPVIVLDNPRNLGNVGAVIRLAAGYGATGVITTGELDPWHPNVLRGSAGLHFGTAVQRLTLPELPAGPLFVLDPDGADIRRVRMSDDALLAFGSERHGVSAELRARADQLVSIPMRRQVSSYNLATSVAMALFHWLSGVDVAESDRSDLAE